MTSAAALVFGVRYLGLSVRLFTGAWQTSLECLGLAVVFYAVNIGLATAAIVVPRTLGAGFVSAYVAGDLVWLVLSLLQAVTFRWWMASKPSS